MKESALLFFAIWKNLGETLIVHFSLFDKETRGTPDRPFFTFWQKTRGTPDLPFFTF